MHFFLKHILAILARIILWKHKPFIIGITGTVGKTTTSRFLVRFLEENFWKNNVGFSSYNYNGEYGMSLAILWAKSWWKNLFSWLSVFKIFLQKFFSKYPQYLVLEYGIDHIGEMDFLLSIARPDIAIVLPISSNHIEQFGTFEAYRDEKFKIFSAKNVILHDSLVDFSRENFLLFGQTEKANIRLISTKLSRQWTEAEAIFREKKFSFTLPVIGDFLAENILALAGVAHILSRDISDVIKISQKCIPEAGRSRIFPLENNALLIDGTYNGGFLSITKGIEALEQFANHDDIFLFLWDMRELGNLTEEKHQELADFLEEKRQKFFKKFVVVLVWPYSEKYILPKIIDKIDVFHFLSSHEAGKFLQKNITEKSIVFAKWSQNTIFLEEWLKYILDEKYHSELCRQSDDWLLKKEKFFQKFS